MTNARLIKIIVIIVLLVSTITVIACCLPIPLQISKQLSGMYWEDGSIDKSVQANISIKGTYYMYALRIFNNNWFSGTISVSNIPYTLESSLPRIEFDRKSSEFASLLYYDPGINAFRAGGMIRESGYFSRIIVLYRNDKSEGYMLLVAPAQSSDTALALAKDLVPSGMNVK